VHNASAELLNALLERSLLLSHAGILSKRLNLSQELFDRLIAPSFYFFCIVTVALSCFISEIFNVEKCYDLEIVVRGHLRSLKVVPFDRLCMVSYSVL